MKPTKLLLALALSLGGALVLSPAPARAQSSTTGGIQGVVTDAKTGEKIAGVTVVVSSPVLGNAQTQSTFTDDNGAYKLNDLPPGVYLVTFYLADLQIQVGNVNVGLNTVTPLYQKIDQSAAGGEIVKVEAKAPTIDPTSTTQGITIDKNYLKNIPVPGRTFEAALGAAAGSQNDGLGVSFSGSTSLENQYYVDGVNTTGLTYGTVGSPIINEFIEEIDIQTGGYNAEYGRATGGVVLVTTKTGSNEVKGSIFGYWQPGALTYATKALPVNATSIDVSPGVGYDADFGFEIGGPIIKDKLWYYVGFAPRFQDTDWTRYTRAQTDCRAAFTGQPGQVKDPNYPGLTTCDPHAGPTIAPNGYGMTGNADGNPDVDPRNGFYITNTLDTEIRSWTTHTYNVLAKLNYALTPEHQGQIAFTALPKSSRYPELFGPPVFGSQSSALTTDLSGKWTSKFNDNKTEVEAVLGWHRDYISTDAIDPANEQVPYQVLTAGSLAQWGPAFGAESDLTNAGCFDSNKGGPPNRNFCADPANAANPVCQDQSPYITNCPMNRNGYGIGGPGPILRDTEERRQAKLSITERLKFAGSHEIKAGIDAEDNTSDKARLYSGGEELINYVNDKAVVKYAYVQLAGQQGIVDNPDPAFFSQTCSDPTIPSSKNPNQAASFYCAPLSGIPGSRGTQVAGETFNWAAYLRDSWQIRPNLTLNAGIRYEEQQLRYAKFLQNTVDPLTQERIGKNAMDLTGEWAPRIGLLWDPTKEGRSKIYGHWGRFYESIPLDINERSFGGEVLQITQWDASKNCGPTDPMIGGPNGQNCGAKGEKPSSQQLFGAAGELIAPGIKAEYLDEFILGAEYEILEDLKLGVSYQHRSFGRIIEDVSTDGANTYIIANPGEWSAADEAAFSKKIMATDDPLEKQRLMHQLSLFQGIRLFDHGVRDYNALQFTLTRRFSKKLYVQGSYTYSKTVGNYPGSVSYDNGQIDPNISSQFDLIELLANRLGPLPQDRPHYIKLDGYYTFDFEKKGQLTLGIRFRALSGVPQNALAGHYKYGPDESFLLPRGEFGRTDFDHGLDVRAIYSHDLGRGMNLSFLLDFYNIYNRQGTFNVDNTYGPQFSLQGKNQNANPISGGTYDDLIWSKAIRVDQSTGAATFTHDPLGRNPDFGRTISRYEPGYIRLGLRLTF